MALWLRYSDQALRFVLRPIVMQMLTFTDHATFSKAMALTISLRVHQFRG